MCAARSRALIAVFSFILFMAACSGGSDRALTIADAESVGFAKVNQQLFQFIGAVDGWGGTWSGETVELYQFESPEQINLSQYQSWIAEGNMSRWVDLCQSGNLMLVSKGKKACGRLKEI
jgi:hypothetical protein